MKTRLVVAAIIEYKGKILMGKKAPNLGPYPNTWHLPGGKVDLENETVEEAVRREIREETGLRLDNFERVGFDEDDEKDKHGEPTHYIFLIHRAKSKSDKTTPGGDLTELKWFAKSELKKIPMTRPSIKYFKNLGLL